MNTNLHDKWTGIKCSIILIYSFKIIILIINFVLNNGVCCIQLWTKYGGK